jgi:hypothetical protein
VRDMPLRSYMAVSLDPLPGHCKQVFAVGCRRLRSPCRDTSRARRVAAGGMGAPSGGRRHPQRGTWLWHVSGPRGPAASRPKVSLPAPRSLVRCLR